MEAITSAIKSRPEFDLDAYTPTDYEDGANEFEEIADMTDGYWVNNCTASTRDAIVVAAARLRHSRIALQRAIFRDGADHEHLRRVAEATNKKFVDTVSQHVPQVALKYIRDAFHMSVDLADLVSPRIRERALDGRLRLRFDAMKAFKHAMCPFAYDGSIIVVDLGDLVDTTADFQENVVLKNIL
jgi:hypothetical protein